MLNRCHKHPATKSNPYTLCLTPYLSSLINFEIELGKWPPNIIGYTSSTSTKHFPFVSRVTLIPCQALTCSSCWKKKLCSSSRKGRARKSQGHSTGTDLRKTKMVLSISISSRFTMVTHTCVTVCFGIPRTSGWPYCTKPWLPSPAGLGNCPLRPSVYTVCAHGGRNVGLNVWNDVAGSVT